MIKDITMVVGAFFGTLVGVFLFLYGLAGLIVWLKDFLS